MKKYKRIFVACVYILIIACLYFKFKDFTVQDILFYTPKNVLLSILFILFLYAFKSMTVIFPIAVLQIASGFLFPKCLAIGVNILGMTIGFSAAYVIGRFSTSEEIAAKVSKNENLLKALCHQKKHGFFTSFFLRIVGCLPVDIVSMYLGNIGVPYQKYILASLLGELPQTILITIMGENILNPKSPEFIMATVFTVLCSVASITSFIIYNKIKNNGAN
ncbi:MAG: VTT domain-containing protein [Clostridia bacterium]|nr:VTT domain-containing protein [Clostridia bacterium]